MLRQIPLVPAYASTTYKVQGITTSSVVAFPFVRGCRGRPPTAALYIVLSRVKTLKGLFLVESISEEDLKYFVPSTELLREESRLLLRHDQTIFQQEK